MYHLCILFMGKTTKQTFSDLLLHILPLKYTCFLFSQSTCAEKTTAESLKSLSNYNHITDWIHKFSVKSIVTSQTELLTKILFFLNLIFLVNNSMGKNFNIILDLVTNSRLFLKKIKFQSY